MRPNRQGDTDRASGSSDWNFFDDDDNNGKDDIDGNGNYDCEDEDS